MNKETFAYIGDLIRTAEDNSQRSAALLTEALKLMGPMDDEIEVTQGT